MHCVQSNQTGHNKQTWTLLSDEKIVEEVIDLVEEMVRKTQQSCEDNAKEEEIICPICIEQIDYDDDSCITKCKHKFHLSCMLKSAKHKTSCPLCRNELVEVTEVEERIWYEDRSYMSEEELLAIQMEQDEDEIDIDLMFSEDLERSYDDSDPDTTEILADAEATVEDGDQEDTGLRYWGESFSVTETVAIREQIMYDNGFREGRSHTIEEVISLREQLNTAQAEIIRLLKEQIEEEYESDDDDE